MMTDEPIRRIAGDLLIAAAGLLTADVLLVMPRKIRTVVLKQNYRKVFCCQMILCAILLVFAFDVRFGFLTGMPRKAANVIGMILRIGVDLLTAVILYFCGRVAAGSVIRSRETANHVIVPGLALENGRPVGDLLLRLDSAAAYAAAHPDAVLILTGGNPDASGQTEAAVMQALLLERGVKPEQMRPEDQAETTKDNFRNTVGMLAPGTPVVLITSNYHMDRAVRTAKRAGFSRVLRRPARSGLLSYGANMLWEVILDINEIEN
ncbi:MAG: YdcF family protein [Oscillospiraceae bacterium]|nr:YdcF family protein [Oscillospiraceae bacterium]MCR4760961.1 YdcF family protein [Oscillospiraceae bacterium]